MLGLATLCVAHEHPFTINEPPFTINEEGNMPTVVLPNPDHGTTTIDPRVIQISEWLHERVRNARGGHIKIPADDVPQQDPAMDALAELNNASHGDVEVRYRPGAPAPMMVTGRLFSAVELKDGMTEQERDEFTSQAFLDRYHALFRISQPQAELKQVVYEKDSLGHRHVRYEQRYRGLRVAPCELIVHLDADGNVTCVNSTHIATPDIDIVPVVDEATAAEVIFDDLGIMIKKQEMTMELVVYGPVDRQTRLAWRAEVTPKFGKPWRYVIDATRPGILSKYSMQHEANVGGEGKDGRDNTRALNVWQDGAKFYMVDTSKPMYNAGASQPPHQTQGAIMIYDAAGKKQINDVNEAAGLVQSNNAAFGWDAEGVGAAFGLSTTHDYYRDRFNRNSLDGNGGTIRAVVNLDVVNAYWQGAAKIMVFGTAFARELDISGHELTHGVTNSVGNGGILDYEFQSGALNESFSDIFGDLVEAWFKQANPDWLKVDPFEPNNPAKYLQNYANPNSVIQGGLMNPAKMSQFYRLSIDQDNGGVHINSSITNHCFYQLAVGLDGAIGLLDAEQIWYRTLTNYLQKQSQFVDLRLGAVRASTDLFGAEAIQTQKVKQAFDYVEIFDAPTSPSPGPVPSVNAPDSTLFLRWEPFFEGFLMGRREAALNDGVGGVYLDTSDFPSFKRISVSGDGSFAAFVTASADLGFLSTDGQTVQFAGFPGEVHAAAMSPDGTRYAIILANAFTGQPTNQMAIVDLATQTEQTVHLVAPTKDGPPLDIVQFGDAIDFAPDGRSVIYDGFVSVPVQGGQAFTGWTLFRYDLDTRTISTVIDLNEGFDFGNPTFAHTRGDLITYEVIPKATRISDVYAASLSTGANELIASLPEADLLAIPSYTGDDTGIVFSTRDNNATRGSLVIQPLQTDGVTPMGQLGIWLSDAVYGAVYRRGQYTATNQAPVAIIVSPTNGAEFTEPASVEINVNASDPDGSISRVGFYLGSELLIEDDQAPYVLRLDNMVAGDHRITVRAHDNVGAVGDSSPVAIRVLPVGGGGNHNPSIAEIPAKTAVQGQELRFNVQASDQDSPPQTLTYSLAAGAPTGAAIDSATGVFSWTPSAVQGPGTFVISVVVHDDAAPPGTAQRDFQVTVEQGGTNHVPQLTSIPNQTIEQGRELTFTATASDEDNQPLTFSLEQGAPVGAVIHSTTGVFTWTPSEVQGPGTFVVIVKVADDAMPPGISQAVVQIEVTAPMQVANRPPVLEPLPAQTVTQGQTLTFSAQASDPDGAAQQLTFSLEPGAPLGAAIAPQSGVFRWTPSSVQGPGTFVIAITVLDNGEPPLKDTKNVLITVNQRVEVLRPSISLQIARLPNRLLELRISGGEPNDIIQIEAAPGLGPWAPVGTLLKTNDVIQFVDPESNAFKSRFYRAKILKLE